MLLGLFTCGHSVSHLFILRCRIIEYGVPSRNTSGRDAITKNRANLCFGERSNFWDYITTLKVLDAMRTR